jgi:uncharacterized protein YjiS (DUF1127 family)
MDRLIRRVAEYRRHRRTERALANLSERDLRDLGLTRHDLRAIRRMEMLP